METKENCCFSVILNLIIQTETAGRPTVLHAGVLLETDVMSLGLFLFLGPVGDEVNRVKPHISKVNTTFSWFYF